MDFRPRGEARSTVRGPSRNGLRHKTGVSNGFSTRGFSAVFRNQSPPYDSQTVCRATKSRGVKERARKNPPMPSAGFEF